MIVVADTSAILDFLDGSIADPYALIRPYRIILISPVAFHEVLRAYPEDLQAHLTRELRHELLSPPSLGHWAESALILRQLFPLRREKNVARMQNDVLIGLSARDIGAPVWSRDHDFELICNHLGVGLISN